MSPDPPVDLDRERERYTRIAAMNGWSAEHRAAFVNHKVAQRAEQNAWRVLEREVWMRGNGAGMGRHYGTIGLRGLMDDILAAETATVEAASTLYVAELVDRREQRSAARQRVR